MRTAPIVLTPVADRRFAARRSCPTTPPRRAANSTASRSSSSPAATARAPSSATPPVAHPLADFRYGVDHAIPDRALTPKLLEKAIKGLPQALDLPPGAHFLTIQAQLDTGAISPVRRFDVPANLLRRIDGRRQPARPGP